MPTPQTFDLRASAATLSHNPNGPWQYGYSQTPSVTGAFVADTTLVHGAGGVDSWHPSGSGQTNTDPGFYPYVAQNTGSAPTADPTDAWAVDPGQAAMEASNEGQYSLVRFVAPTAGVYTVSAAFVGIHFRLSTTDVHVLDNGSSLFDGNIIGYGGDAAFHPVQGGSPAVTYHGTVTLRQGDVLTFAVGAGDSATDGSTVTNFNDTTGLMVHLVEMPAL